MGNTHSSAGVYVNEIDLSQRIQQVSTSIGAIVGASDKGPVMETTLITSIPNFIATFGPPNPRRSYMHYCALKFLETSSRLNVTRVISNKNDALTAGAYLSVDDLTAVTPILRLNNFDDGTSNPLGKYDPLNTLVFDPTQPGIDQILMAIVAINPGTWNNNIYLQVRPSTPRGGTVPIDPTTFWIDVFINYTGTGQQPTESWLVSRDYRLDGYGQQMNYVQVVNTGPNRSNYIRVIDNPYAAPTLNFLTTAARFLAGGTNGSIVDDSDIINGWALYQDVEQVDVNILINGGYSTPAVHRAMDAICQNRMDCIAVLDMPSNVQQTASGIDYRRNTLNLDSSRSAIYTPDLYVQDTYNDIKLYVPPSGHVASAYALTDSVAAVWFAPAGMTRGDLSVLGVRQVYKQGDRDAFDDAQINCIRVIPASGFKIWGQSTMQSMASALSNVNVRRLLCYLEKSIAIASLYGCYEPGDEILWSRLRFIVEGFLAPIQSGRGLYRFEVVCDGRNNTPNVIATGDTILDVYLDPVIPAKRIHLNAIVTKTGANFNELIIQRQQGA